MNQTELEISDSISGQSTGCVVVLEPGAKWPDQAFASVEDRAGVAVVHESPGETAEHFFTRLARQFTKVAANGVLIRTVLVACAVTGAVGAIDRDQLAAHVQNHALFAPTGTVVFVAGDGSFEHRGY